MKLNLHFEIHETNPMVNELNKLQDTRAKCKGQLFFYILQ